MRGLLENRTELIYKACRSYHQPFQHLSIEKTILSKGRHGDNHFKVKLDDTCYSLRLIPYMRYKESAFSLLTDTVLVEQLKYSDYLIAKGIPFMKRLEIGNNRYFTKIYHDGVEWRCCMFEWIEGEHITRNTVHTAEQVGKFAREFHDVSLPYISTALPNVRHTSAYQKWVNSIRAYLKQPISPKNRRLLTSYLELTQKYIDSANHVQVRQELKIITSDLNSLNVLWDKQERIVGVVDHEHISYSDRVQDLAWLIKWYSRTDGIESHNVASTLASALLKGYEAQAILKAEDYDRLTALLWLSGCFNYNFIRTTIDILDRPTEENERLEEHLSRYLERGKLLIGLVL
jgi:Ser/Thr protein kinase RdoA (MazF antagonist)